MARLYPDADFSGAIVTDGPFAESKEHIAGFYIINAADLDDAMKWAAIEAIAEAAGELSPTHILPAAFDRSVAVRVGDRVAHAAQRVIVVRVAVALRTRKPKLRRVPEKLLDRLGHLVREGLDVHDVQRLHEDAAVGVDGGSLVNEVDRHVGLDRAGQVDLEEVDVVYLAGNGVASDVTNDDRAGVAAVDHHPLRCCPIGPNLGRVAS